MKQQLLFLFALLIFASCTNREVKVNTTQASDDSIMIKLFQIPDTTGEQAEWGYDIFIHGKLYIHQPNIPAVPGNHGFASEEQANKVAELVAYKVRNHILPPTVSVAELDSLKIKIR